MNQQLTRRRLNSITLKGFKSIESLDALSVGDVNVLIGPNGAGKSNLIAFFRMLSWMLAPPGELQFFVGKQGGANALLHGGAERTPQITAEMTFETGRGINQYSFRLFHAARDTFIFAEEKYRFVPQQLPTSKGKWSMLGAGHREAELVHRAEQDQVTPRTILNLLLNCIVYQFHNTSESARIRQKWNADDNRYLKEDGANLAPLLLRLREQHPHHYGRIVETMRQVSPQFADFVLERSEATVLLQWRERFSDMIFGPQQASDGTLRLMALVTLLLQPEKEHPALLIFDEPELGLHPSAIGLVAGLLQSVSNHTQVLLATQSTTLLDYFEPNQVIVVEHEKNGSQFRRLDPERLREWLDEYSLSDLWEKNVIGGRSA